MSMGLDDADLAEETEDDDKNLMEQGDDENSEVQSDPTAQGIYNIILLIIASNIGILTFIVFFQGFKGWLCRRRYINKVLGRGLHAQTFYCINKLVIFSPSSTMLQMDNMQASRSLLPT